MCEQCRAARLLRRLNCRGYRQGEPRARWLLSLDEFVLINNVDKEYPGLVGRQSVGITVMQPKAMPSIWSSRCFSTKPRLRPLS